MTPFQLLRNRSIMTFVTLMMTLQVINISIDPLDTHHSREELVINEIESCVEFIVEVVLGDDEAIHETEERDESSQKPQSRITLFACPVIHTIFAEQSKSRNVIGFLVNQDVQSPALPVNAPPPKCS